MNETAINWTEYTWNPASGCDKVSEGCKHCYAFTLAERKRGTLARPLYTSHLYSLYTPCQVPLPRLRHLRHTRQHVGQYHLGRRLKHRALNGILNIVQHGAHLKRRKTGYLAGNPAVLVGKV